MRKIFATLLLFTLLLSLPAHAISLISDEETESYIYEILTPLFKSANLPLERQNIHIVKDDSLNAFVGDKNHMFVHTGTLLKSDNSNQIEGVLAHETGHILGGHILRLKLKMQDLQKATMTSLIAAAGAAVASGRGDAAIAVVLGTQSSAINAMTAYQVSEERSADETAVMLLKDNKKSIQGLKDFMKKIQKTNRLQGVEEIPYFRTHPVTTERVSYFDDKLKKETNTTKNYDMDKKLTRLQAKLYAYLEPLENVLKKYPLDDNSIEANIAHSIYYMRLKDINKGLQYANKLVSAEPNNPYFWEIKAQSLYESGKIKESVPAYKETLRLKPNSDLFKLSYAEAVLANAPTRAEIKSVIPLLEQTNQKTPRPQAYWLLGQAHNLLQNNATADYYLAEYYYSIGDERLTKRQLNKLQKQTLPPSIKLKAEDLDAKIKSEMKKKSLF